MKIKKRELSTILLIMAYVIVSFFTATLKSSTYLINPLLWFGIFIFVFYFNQDYKNRNKSKYENSQNIMIILFVFSILFFGSGLIFGYQYNIFSKSLVAVVKNVMTFVFIIFLQEYVRHVLLARGPKNNIYYILITLVFIFVQVNIHYLIGQFSSPLNILEYLCTDFILIVINNIILSYMSLKVNAFVAYLYRLVLIILSIFLPIVPAHEWLVSFLFRLALVTVLTYSIMRREILSSREYNKKELKNKNYLGLFLNLLVLLVAVLFITKFFIYFPVAIASDSMKPVFSRYSAVIVEKIKESNEIETGDIIYFQMKDKMITHRVIDKQYSSSKIYFKTKGDNNETEDEWLISLEEIQGKVKFSVPYLAYPSIKLAEFLER